MTYVIRFDYPDSAVPLFAGMHKGAFGWAPTLSTALLYDDAETAQRVLENAYGENSKRHGRVVQAEGVSAVREGS